MRASGARKSIDLLLGGKSSRLVARVPERAVDADVELARLAGLELDVRDAFGLQRVPHPEGLRQIASAAAVLDEHVHTGLLLALIIATRPGVRAVLVRR